MQTDIESIISHPKIYSPEEALQKANDLPPNQEIWEVVLRRDDVRKYLTKTLAPQVALQKAKELGKASVWEVVLRRSDISPEVVLQKAKMLNDQEIWEVVLRLNDVLEYLKD